jgi:hypothetical protein
MRGQLLEVLDLNGRRILDVLAARAVTAFTSLLGGRRSRVGRAAMERAFDRLIVTFEALGVANEGGGLRRRRGLGRRLRDFYG